MPKIVAISGSLRKGSYNTLLMRAAIELAPKETTFEVGSIREIPLYDGDVEAGSGIPASVQALKQQIVAADGLLLVSPEYNNSIPGVLKNAIDWLSRPASDIGRVFGMRPVGVIGASPGRGGTTLSQNAWLPVLRTLGTLTYSGGRVMVSGAADVFDAQGKVQDAAVKGLLEKYVKGFAEFVGKYGARG
jgi:NAD(P)H-dependent FMN reductase